MKYFSLIAAIAFALCIQACDCTDIEPVCGRIRLIVYENDSVELASGSGTDYELLNPLVKSGITYIASVGEHIHVRQVLVETSYVVGKKDQIDSCMRLNVKRVEWIARCESFRTDISDSIYVYEKLPNAFEGPFTDRQMDSILKARGLLASKAKVLYDASRKLRVE